ncbi:uncharacterized protein LOC106468044 [Limulus polyphemus]|uniref:Uncharacterized protein LOC106468044 n=1 Tax=Limulus polyphemus TaxID=6850 RepID=A0ABM1T853_LIMPO|nr:uncharacterized protein LOC106468044 [Limulus polyphemus]XP_022252058.1 uncharacterized protein LOC106468044 [Limulus polyphemus]XP_022252059.1 uncharacterized protein LOC106468044 [Limulus polyphemus]
MKSFLNVFGFTLMFGTFGTSFGGENNIVVTISPEEDSITKRVNEDLNLVCRVTDENIAQIREYTSSGSTELTCRYTLTWTLPIKLVSKKARISYFRGCNELIVTVHQLQKEDSGLYICEVTGESVNVRHPVSVTVQSRKNTCLGAFFPCKNIGKGMCIFPQYVCDGYEDCPGGSDEDPDLCDQKKSAVSSNVHQPYRNLSFLQSTVYTIVSCAIAFIFITTVMVVAICRIHMRKSAMSLHSRRRCSSTSRSGLWRSWFGERRSANGNLQNHGNNQEGRSHVSDADLEDASSDIDHSQVPLNPYSCTLSSHGSFIVSYSVGNGVHFIRHLPKPPPYSETLITSSGPPPPYSSVENINCTSSAEGTSSTNATEECNSVGALK